MPNCKMFGLTNTKCNEHSSCMQVGHNRTQQRVYDGETQWATGRWSVDAAAGEARAPRAVRPAARLMNEPTRVLLLSALEANLRRAHFNVIASSLLRIAAIIADIIIVTIGR